ncbi:protein AGENET DOMAIN (AGD)-CONTAINING P1 [Sesamum angolense]|uniref:Protein AGENET DOMAIN (AGD)-CONTAINING P1 n=1 Tax=Sesamum angolense TaxID=2727404 RepID=A0AAE2C2L0_9LAMI|nr:protein AGENET DOMAIN (AGD)-CONTAINING P1 [Sesamum angolense]
MAASSRDSTSQYFKKGAEVEISSDEEGFRGSWYAGTVVRPPGNVKRGSAKLRPPPPREKRRSFKFSEEVDAYYSDGWWEGIITEVVGEDKYLVFFRGTREQIAFKASELRLHREWVHGKWVPPLEPAQDVTPEIELGQGMNAKESH